MEIISGNLAEIFLIVEGAISLYEKNPSPDADAYSLIGEALYLMREKVSECLTDCQLYGKDSADN